MDPQAEGQIEPVVLPDVTTAPHPTAAAVPQPEADVFRDGSEPSPPPTAAVDPRVGGTRHGQEPRSGKP
jgi:hypothetical protein